MSQLYSSLLKPSKVSVLNLHPELTIYVKVNYEKYNQRHISKSIIKDKDDNLLNNINGNITTSYETKQSTTEYNIIPETITNSGWTPILPKRIKQQKQKPFEFTIKHNTASVDICTNILGTQYSIASGYETEAGETIVFKSLKENITIIKNTNLINKIEFNNNCLYSIKLLSNNSKRLKETITNTISCHSNVTKDLSCFILHPIEDKMNHFYIECKLTKNDKKWFGCRNKTNDRLIYLRNKKERSYFKLIKSDKIINNQIYYKIKVFHRSNRYMGFLGINGINLLQCVLPFENNYFTFENQDE